MSIALSRIPQVVRPIRSFPDRGQAKVKLNSKEGIRSQRHLSHDRGPSDAPLWVACEQSLSMRRQRFGIITLYSLAILLAAGHVPGFSL